MASNAPGKCCVETNYHEGSPSGKYETTFGLDTYVTGSGDKTIVILTDIYGHKYNNVALIADQFAKAGYSVYIPDILKGEPVEDISKLGEWLPKHSSDITKPIVDGFLGELRKKIGSSAFVGVIGYCFGAKYAIQQISEQGLASAAAIAHPSFVDIGEVAAVTKPLLISAAQTDPIFTTELRHATEAKLEEIEARYQIDVFSGVVHGYACRGDLSDAVVKYAAEKTLNDQLFWFETFSKEVAEGDARPRGSNI